MSIKYICSNCGQKCESDDEYAGQKVNCKCGALLEIPKLESIPAIPVEVHDSPPAAAVVMYCTNCGAAIEESYKFCKSCGFALSAKNSSEKDNVKQDAAVDAAKEKADTIEVKPVEAEPAKTENSICPVCNAAIIESSSFVPCSACGIKYHPECWKTNLGCSTYGCPMVGSLKPRNERKIMDQGRKSQPADKVTHILKTKNSLLYNPIVYMPSFGLLAGLLLSLCGWGLSLYTEDRYPFYLLSIAIFISAALAIAESVMIRNWNQAIRNVLLGIIVGAIGAIISFFISNRVATLLYFDILSPCGILYLFPLPFRVIDWSILIGIWGMFSAITTGIITRSGKKIRLGLFGGLSGGLIAGMLSFLTSHCLFIGNLFLSVTFLPVIIGTIIGLTIGILENREKKNWLKVVSGLIAGKQFILYRNPTYIGSSPKCEIYLFKDAQIAGRHAAISQNDEGFFIENIDQSGITLVNKMPVTRQRLYNGDNICIGTTQLVFESKKVSDAR